MTEYAIILSFENGEQSVSYHKCESIREAMRVAEDSKRTAAAEFATVAANQGFIDYDDRQTIHEDVSDFRRGYYEARGMIGHTYMSAHYKLSRPEWYDRESDEYKRGFSAGIASLARF